MRRNPTSRTSHLAMLFLFALVIAVGIVAIKKVHGRDGYAAREIHGMGQVAISLGLRPS